jgi:hypothetical protein
LVIGNSAGIATVDDVTLKLEVKAQKLLFTPEKGDTLEMGKKVYGNAMKDIQ